MYLEMGKHVGRCWISRREGCVEDTKTAGGFLGRIITQVCFNFSKNLYMNEDLE